MKTSYANADLNIVGWQPTGDFADAHPRSRLSAPWNTLSVMGVSLHLEAWEIELTDTLECYRAANPDLRDDLDAVHGAFMADGRFRMAQVQFPDETTPRLYVVFAYPHGD